MNPKKIAELISTMQPASMLQSGIRLSSNGAEVPFEIRHGWDITLASNCDAEWAQKNVEILEFLRGSVAGEEELLKEFSKLHMEDAHWRWIGKSLHYFSDEYNWFFWVAEGSVQGACLIYHPKESAVDGQGIFYIEYVAVSPWNRPNPLAPIFLKGVGSDLIKAACGYATEHLGLRPGFSLHSLPKAAAYYSKIGMICFPERKKDSLDYYEMTKESAEAFGRAANV